MYHVAPYCPLFTMWVFFDLRCVNDRHIPPCCNAPFYAENRALPEAGRTRPALYGLYEVARCTPLFLPRLLPLPRR